MNKIPTAEEYWYNKGYGNPSLNEELALIEFTKFHVQAALKAAALSAKLDIDAFSEYEGYDFPEIDEDSILNAYPLSNIK